MEKEKSIGEFLKEKKVEELVKKVKMIELTTGNTVEEALSILSKGKIRSAPLYDKKTSKFLGLIDLNDILAYLLSVYPTEEELEEDFIRTISFTGFNLVKNNLQDLVNLSKNNPTIKVISEKNPILDLCDLFQAGLHRIPLEDEKTNKVTNIISQATAINYIFSNIKQFSKLASKTIKELEFTERKTNSVKPDTKVVKVINTMITKKYSAVAIVDDKQKPVADFCVRDIKGLDSNCFVDLTLSVKDFLEEKNSYKLVTCSPTTTFGQLLEIIVKNKLYRVWIIENNKLTSVVTLTDIFKFIMFTK